MGTHEADDTPRLTNLFAFPRRASLPGRGLPIALHHELAAIGVVLTAGEMSPSDSHVPIPVLLERLAVVAFGEKEIALVHCTA